MPVSDGDFNLERELGKARSGGGTSYLNPVQASALLDLCERVGETVSWIEAFEVADDVRYFDLSRGMVDYFNRDFSDAKLKQIARERIDWALNAPGEWLFILWV